MKTRPSLVLTGIAIALIGAAPPPPGGVLEVRVGNVRNARGSVHIDICPEAVFLKKNCPYSATAPTQAGTTIVVAHGIPAGRYAVQAFHDENGNGDVDRALFGIPKEGVGFSNDARIRLRPPKFADAVFTFDGQDKAIALNLRYFSGPSGPSAR